MEAATYCGRIIASRRAPSKGRVKRRMPAGRGTITSMRTTCAVWSLQGILLLIRPGGILGEPQSEGVVTPSCCAQVFLSSSGPLSTSQSSHVMGIYTLSSQKIAGNPKPVYTKSETGQDYYLYYRDKEEGPRGWLVGSQLLEDSFFLTTKQEDGDCPNGLYGAFDTLNARDDTFAIECHTDQVKVPCCETVTVSSTESLATTLGGVLGTYHKTEDVNGHTAYRGGQTDTSLFFRKAGYGPDGWTIGPDLDQSSFMITTRNKGFCPDEVMKGYAYDREGDSSFRVECTVSDEIHQVQDPGVPVTPLGSFSNREETSGSSHQTLNKTFGFGLVSIIYLLLLIF